MTVEASEELVSDEVNDQNPSQAGAQASLALHCQEMTAIQHFSISYFLISSFPISHFLISHSWFYNNPFFRSVVTKKRRESAHARILEGILNERKKESLIEIAHLEHAYIITCTQDKRQTVQFSPPGYGHPGPTYRGMVTSSCTITSSGEDNLVTLHGH